MRADGAIVEEIQVFEQVTGRIQLVMIGRLMKVNEKSVYVEHDIDNPELSMPAGASQRCGMTYPILPHWSVRTRLAGSAADFVTKHKGWDRRVGSHVVRPERERLVGLHQTSGRRGPYNAGNGSGKAGYGKGR